MSFSMGQQLLDIFTIYLGRSWPLTATNQACLAHGHMHVPLLQPASYANTTAKPSEVQSYRYEWYLVVYAMPCCLLIAAPLRVALHIAAQQQATARGTRLPKFRPVAIRSWRPKAHHSVLLHVDIVFLQFHSGTRSVLITWIIASFKPQAAGSASGGVGAMC
jgi:hypothetical protein